MHGAMASRGIHHPFSHLHGVLLFCFILVAGVAAAATVLASSNTLGNGSSPASKDPQTLLRSGSQKFVSGDVEGSLVDFDAALAAKPSIRPYLWQRGLSLYYIGTKEALEEGAKQFRDDVAVNPNDTEVFSSLIEAGYNSFLISSFGFASLGSYLDVLM